MEWASGRKRASVITGSVVQDVVGNQAVMGGI